MHRFCTLVVSFSSAFSLASGSFLNSGSVLKGRQAESQFGLYAYGDGIGGFPVFYSDGLAYTGDGSQLTDAVNIVFSSSSTAWSAAPNSTASSNSTTTFTNATFFVPSPGSSSTQIGFLDSGSTANSSITTTGFLFYGHVAMLDPSSGGSFQSLFSAIPTSNAKVWSLNWNVTGDSTAIPITLKDSAPSRAPDAVKAKAV